MLFLVIVPFWTNSLIRTYGLKAGILGTRGILSNALMYSDIIDKPIRIMYTEYYENDDRLTFAFYCHSWCYLCTRP